MAKVSDLNIQGLDQLVKALTAKPVVARVGILGSSNHFAQLKQGQSQPAHAVTNAEIGAVHEFGTSKIPQRSFLRIPISDNLNREMDRSNLFDQDVLKDVIESGSVVPWVKNVAIAAEGCVLDAFNTGGNGKWPAWKNPNYENNTGQLLVDTQQLRNSITSEVIE